MAEEIQIAGTQAKAKIRSPWAPALLPFITLGIYYWVWYYKINREMADLGRAKNTDELGDSPGKSLLAVTLGALIIVPAIISIVHTAQRIQRAQRLSGVDPQLNGWLALLLAIVFSPAFYAYQQSELNKVWNAPGAGATAAVEAASTSPSPVDEPAAPTGEQVPPAV